MDFISYTESCCSFLLRLPPPTPHVSDYYCAVFSRLSPGVFKPLHLSDDNFLVQMLVTAVTMTPMSSFVLLHNFLRSTAGFFSCCCLDPLSSTYSLGSAASRWSARLCCSFPDYTLVKASSCLFLGSQGAFY